MKEIDPNRSSKLHTPDVGYHLYVQSAYINEAFPAAIRKITSACERLIEAMPFSTAEGFQQHCSILADWRLTTVDLGLRVDVGLSDVAIFASGKILKETR